MFYILLSLFTDTLQMTTGHERADSARSCPCIPSSTPRGRPGHGRAHLCSPMPCVPLFLSFDSVGTPRTRASTLVLARVLISVSSTLRGRTGHERAYRCSLVSLSRFLRHCADAQDTSEHIGARLCPVCPYSCPFDTTRTPRARASTQVLARVLISLS